MEALSLLALPTAVVLAGVTGVILFRVLRQIRLRTREQAVHAGRQEKLADLGRKILSGGEPEALRQAALASLAAGLDVERTAVFENRNDALVLVAGTGWPDRGLQVDAGPASQAGASLAGGDVVVCEPGARNQRFPGDAPLVALGARGGVTVPIRGRHAVPGVLAAFDSGERRWSADDIHFVESMAGMLGAGLGLRDEEQALRASEEMRRSITESSPDYIMKIDRAGTILYINRAMPGLTVEGVLGTSIYSHVPDEYRPVLADCYRRVFETGEPDRYEVEYHSDDGTTCFECRVGPVMRDGEVEALIINASDVTERTRTERELRQSRSTFEQMAASIRDIIYLAEILPGGKVRLAYVSPAFETVFRMPVSQIQNNPGSFSEMLHEEDRERVFGEMAAAAAGGRNWDLVYRIQRPDGEVRWLEDRCNLVLDDDGTPSLLCGSVADVTERVRADEEKALLEAKLRQSQKLEAVGTLASGVAHDFNNLLTAINGSADLALERLDGEHAARRSLKLIKKVTGQAVSVTRSLLTFGRHTESRKQAENLTVVVADSMGFLRRLLPAAIDIRQEKTDDSLWVDADRDQIQQVLMNLALNARDAMPDGGELTVSVTPADGGQEAVLKVEDRGAGMEPDLVGRIFEPFFTTKPRGKGTGLGLAVVHGIVQDHGGTIEVASRPGEGTTFTVRLPRTDSPSRAREKVRAARAPVSVEGPILLAEDNEDVRAVLLAGLERAGVEVIAAADGDEALARFGERAEQVRLVVLDVDLPRRSGIACLEGIREQRPDLPAVFITGDPGRMSDRPLQHHERLLAKPFPTEELVDRIAELLT